MGEGWYRVREMMDFGYSKRYLMDMYNKPGQRYAKKRNPLKKNSVLYFNLERFKEAEEKDNEMQARSRERRTSIA